MAYPLPLPIPTPSAGTHPLRAVVASGKRMRAGAWRAAAGQALSLQPQADTDLVVRQGALWVTLDANPAGGRLGASGDWVLQPGERLRVPAGRHAVLQPLDAGRSGWFDCVEAAAVPTQRQAAWQVGVAQPAAELVRAAGGVLAASGRLVRGVAVWLAAGLPRRPGAAPCAQP